MRSATGAIRYRPDIDGLRSLAILPILLFHAGLAQLHGGFTGVDIFFVISGYLITAILTREVGEGRFSVAEFYHRRVVRILPALAFVLLASLAVGCLFLLPSELADLGRSAAAAAAFGSNILLWLTTDYFGASADSQILIHTWSLAVEEQFYIFYPLLLILLRRYAPSRIEAVLAAIALLSFAWDIYLALTSPTAAFYLFPGRIWELALGGLVSLGFLPAVGGGRRRDLLAITGILSIAAGLVVIKPESIFPAPYALLPCVGAMLLIAYGEGTLIGRMLATRPPRWIGLISYSLYLWHWPIITFYRLKFGMTLHLRDTLILLVASMAAASFSYHVVEKPVMKRWRTGSTAKVNAAGFAGIAALVALALAIAAYAPSLRPLPSQVARVTSYIGYDKSPEGVFQFRPGLCFATSASAPFESGSCLTLSAARPNLVVLGDSHAAQYWRAIAERFPDMNVLQATASGCRPLIRARGLSRCTKVMRTVFDDLVPQGRIAGVVLGGRWLRKESDQLTDTVRYLRDHGVRVTVIGPMVEYDGDYPNLLARAMLKGDPNGVGAYRLADRRRFDLDMAAQVRAAGGTYVSEQDAECPAGRCILFAPDGSPVHFDYGHLTLSASRYVMRGLPQP